MEPLNYRDLADQADLALLRGVKLTIDPMEVRGLVEYVKFMEEERAQLIRKMNKAREVLER